MIVVAGLEQSSGARGCGEEDPVICKIAWQEWVEEWYLGIGVVIWAQEGWILAWGFEAERKKRDCCGQTATSRSNKLKKATLFSESPFNFTAIDAFTIGIGQKNGGIELIPPNY